MSAGAAHARPGAPLLAVTQAGLAQWLGAQDEATRRWVDAVGFLAQPATWCAIPAADGALARVLVGVADPADTYAFAHLPFALPEAEYRIEPGAVAIDPARAALGFALGSYQFSRYRAARRAPARLALPDGVDAARLAREVAAVALVRDLVNTPSEDMGPAHLQQAAAALAQAHGAQFQAFVGAELLARNFPAIHAVGRASHREPRLLELSWGDPAHPRLAIVGKGVCFDTGGLDLKSTEGMRWMKKDMGGAAHALALAGMVMDAKLPVRLQLLIPAVENAVGPDAYRPGEVVRTRAGHTVEIDNTDAEGRVILCDALAYAVESAPGLILDFATLTGAARVALGPELPALFSNREELAQAYVAASRERQDPVWHMPLWQPYRSMLDSGIADFANGGPSRMAGAITAALYLQRFVPDATPWCHLDTYAWNDIDRPGRPRGGEAQGVRAGFAFLQQRYAPPA